MDKLCDKILIVKENTLRKILNNLIDSTDEQIKEYIIENTINSLKEQPKDRFTL